VKHIKTFLGIQKLYLWYSCLGSTHSWNTNWLYTSRTYR